MMAKCTNARMIAEYLEDRLVNPIHHTQHWSNCYLMTLELKLGFEGMTWTCLLGATLASTGEDIESSSDAMSTGR